MAGKYPYVNSPGPFMKTIEQFRKTLPPSITAATLKKLGIAPNNESYVLNTLRFLGFIDAEGKRTEHAPRIFNQHPEEAFARAMEPVVKEAYSEIFDLHGLDSWNLGRDELIAFFRNDDGSSAVVGARQAATFSTLARLAGHGAVIDPRPRAPQTNGAKGKETRRSKVAVPAPAPGGASNHPKTSSLGMTVRIEINLPVSDDQSVYDRIFQSIRANLIDAPID